MTIKMILAAATLCITSLACGGVEGEDYVEGALDNGTFSAACSNGDLGDSAGCADRDCYNSQTQTSGKCSSVCKGLVITSSMDGKTCSGTPARTSPTRTTYPKTSFSYSIGG